MEPIRHPLRQLHSGQGFRAHGFSIPHPHAAAVGDLIVHVADQEAIIFTLALLGVFIPTQRKSTTKDQGFRFRV